MCEVLSIDTPYIILTPQKVDILRTQVHTPPLQGPMILVLLGAGQRARSGSSETQDRRTLRDLHPTLP